MGNNDHVIVGPPRMMILFKLPATPTQAHVRLLTTLDVVGKYREGFFLATCSQEKLARLRDAGAEVVVLDADANHFAAQIAGLSDEARIALVEKRRAEARTDMAVADAGTHDTDDDKGTT